MLEESWPLSNKTTSSQGTETWASYSQRNMTVPRPVRSWRQFLQDSLSLSFSLRNMTLSAPPNCLPSNPLHSFSNTEHRPQKWLIYALQASIIFVLSKQEEHISYRSVVPKDQNKLCAHDKNRRRAELWVKICNVCIRFDTWKKFDEWNKVDL